MPLYQDETANLSSRDRPSQPPDQLARSGLPVPEWTSVRVEDVGTFNYDVRRMVARISSLFALLAPTVQGAPEATDSLELVAHAPQHQNGGSDEINVGGLSGLLADDQNPVPHDIEGDRHFGVALNMTDVLTATGPTTFQFQPLAPSLIPGLIKEVEIDFGPVAVKEKVFAVADGNCAPNSRVIMLHSGKAASGKQADEAEFDAIDCRCEPYAGGFRVYATSLLGHVFGLFKFNYTVSTA
jgi:hypothetical protein